MLSGRGMQTALQLGQSHGSKLRKLLSSTNIKPHISNELAMALDTPLRFTRPGRGGVLATGYEATILPLVNAYEEAIAELKAVATPTE